MTVRLGFDAFAKAIELDSAFAPAYEHIVGLADARLTGRLCPPPISSALPSSESPGGTTRWFAPVPADK